MSTQKNNNDLPEVSEGTGALYGLVLAGGMSKRMKRDKSVLKYHGKSQVAYCYDLLSQFCPNVFVSNRADQADLPEYKSFPQIHDSFSNIGPLDGILSAMAQYPHAAWLVLACDLPFVDGHVLKKLIEQRDLKKIATAYRSTNDNLPEPLCAIYEPHGISSLLGFLNESCACPRKILINSNIHLIDQDQNNSLDNINNPKEYQDVYDTLESQIKCKNNL